MQYFTRVVLNSDSRETKLKILLSQKISQSFSLYVSELLLKFYQIDMKTQSDSSVNTNKTIENKTEEENMNSKRLKQAKWKSKSK